MTSSPKLEPVSDCPKGMSRGIVSVLDVESYGVETGEGLPGDSTSLKRCIVYGKDVHRFRKG